MTGTSAKRYVALIICTVAAAVCAPVAVSAAPGQPLRVASVDPVGSNAQIVVVVPPQLANLDVPSSAFNVTQAGRNLPMTARRVADAGIDLYIVLDTSVSGATLMAEQSAAADLLRNLPSDVRTATATDGGPSLPSVQPGNAAALRALAAARPQATTTLHETLNTIASLPVGDRRRVIVMMTDCREQGVSDLGVLVAALGKRDLQLNVVAAGSGCTPKLSALASSGGGLALIGQPLDRLDQAVDAVRYDLLGQYRLSIPRPPQQQSLTVAVDHAGVQATTGAFSLHPAANTLSSPVTQSRSGEYSRSRLLNGLAALFALLVISAAIVARVARRERSPALKADVVRADVGRSDEAPHETEPPRSRQTQGARARHGEHRRVRSRRPGRYIRRLVAGVAAITAIIISARAVIARSSLRGTPGDGETEKASSATRRPLARPTVRAGAQHGDHRRRI